jgi:hypothetical protein
MATQNGNNNKYNIVKIPRRVEASSRPQTFPKMPRLYLELIENKGKIQQDLINKEYKHDESTISREPVYSSPPQPRSADSDRSSSREKYSRRSDRSDNDAESVHSIVDDDSVKDVSPSRSDRSSKHNNSDDDDDDNSVRPSKSEYRDHHTPESDNRSIVSNGSPDLSKRLTDLLDDSDTESVRRSKKKNKYSKHRDRDGHSISKVNTAPSFAELEAKGAYVPKKELRDVNHVTSNEQADDDLKRELLFKFELLRKSYPTATIPVYSVHTEYKTMLNAYEDCVRRLSLDSNVEKFKQYLIYGFMGFEFVLGRFLKFDMEGFTQQQIVSMSSYEKLLIELGEKSYVPEGSKWSVELRLLFLVMINAAFFIVSKMIMKKTGANLMGMMNGMTAKAASFAGGGDSSAPKRKMKEPDDIDLDDLDVI